MTIAKGSATVTTAIALAAYAGLVGIVHGLFQISRGWTVTGGLLINAVGPPCRPEAVWHACLPALTLLPNYLLSGLGATIAGLLILTWIVRFRRRGSGGPLLLLLSFGLLLAGGGFVAAFAGTVAGLALTGRRPVMPHLRGPLGRAAARLWPWPLLLFVGWAVGGWILGFLFNDALLELGGVPFVIFDLGLPLLSVVSAWAVDGRSARIPPTS